MAPAPTPHTASRVTVMRASCQVWSWSGTGSRPRATRYAVNPMTAAVSTMRGPPSPGTRCERNDAPTATAVPVPETHPTILQSMRRSRW